MSTPVHGDDAVDEEIQDSARKLMVRSIQLTNFMHDHNILKNLDKSGLEEIKRINEQVQQNAIECIKITTDAIIWRVKQAP
jgi:hypothetical protein